MADVAVTNGTEATGGINPLYLYGGITVGAIVLAGVSYWYFTQKPVSKTEADVKTQEKKNEAENKAAADKENSNKENSNTPTAKDYAASVSAKALNPSSPQTAGAFGLGDKITVQACKNVRRLNEKLEYSGDADSQKVGVTLGSAWGFTDANHALITDSGKTPVNIIIKSDDKKVAPFYEVKLEDVRAKDAGFVAKTKEKAACLFDDGHSYVGADGFDSTTQPIVLDKLLRHDSWEA